MAKKKKNLKPNVVSGGLSTREKLASKNPAAREEGQREAASLSAERRKAAVTGAQDITKRGFAQTIPTQQVKGPTPEQISNLQKRESPSLNSNIEQPTPQQQVSSLSPVVEEQLLQQEIAQPVEEQSVVQEQPVVGLDLFEKQLSGEQLNPEEKAAFQQQMEKATLGGLSVGVPAAGLLYGAATTISTTSATIARSAAGQVTKKTVTKGIAQNTKNAAKTSSYLTKLAKLATNPKAVGSAILGALGSYPFAGFIKEEALQTVGFATTMAIKNKDIVGAEEALQLQQEILNPSLWNQIIGGVPYANVMVKLEEYYKAATLQMEVNQKEVARLKSNLGNYSISEEEKAKREEANAYYENIRAQNEAYVKQKRAETEAYYAKIRGKTNTLTDDEKLLKAKEIFARPGERIE